MRSPWISTVFRGRREREPRPIIRARGGLARSMLLVLLPLGFILLSIVTVAGYLQARSVAVAVVGILAMALYAGCVIVFTRRLTDPLQILTNRALRLVGSNLPANAQAELHDEIGLLLAAFNVLSGELRGFYRDLEMKVEARTQQLAAVADVGRAATSILSMEHLLAETVELIQQRFGYYHVSVFLLDESGRTAVLREATGDVGQELKAREHRVDVGSNSLVGWVTANKKPRIALDADASTEPAHMRAGFLPATRSQAVLPLRVGDRLIGALDVHSREPKAFGQSEIDTLQILADQISVALENGRLFSRQQHAAQLEQRIVAVTAKIHKALTVDAMLDSAATELGRALGASKVVVRLMPASEARSPANETERSLSRPPVTDDADGRGQPSV